METDVNWVKLHMNPEEQSRQTYTSEKLNDIVFQREVNILSHGSRTWVIIKVLEKWLTISPFLYYPIKDD